MSHKLMQFTVSVIFHTRRGKEIDSKFWYFVAHDVDEAQVYFNKYVEKYIDNNLSSPFIIDYYHNWLYVCNVDQVTWEPYGRSVVLRRIEELRSIAELNG